MKLTIKPAINGALVYTEYDASENESGEASCETMVYEFEEGKLDGLQSMLYDLISTFDSSGRYSEQRIKISIVHGDKYECTAKDCEICEEENAFAGAVINGR